MGTFTQLGSEPAAKMLASVLNWLGCSVMKRNILGLALAGGTGRRLGRDKALLTFHGKSSQLDYTLAVLDTFCSMIAISGREDQRYERRSSLTAPFVSDVDGVDGPMSGVIAGLRFASNLPVLVSACDMPLVDAPLVLKLLCQRNPEKKASCFVGQDGRPEPLLAVYEPESLKELEKLSRDGMFSLRQYLERVEVEYISCSSPQLLASVNTPEDLELAKEQIARESV